jgi:nucleoside-diphosphate-sugar epimerase
MTVLITGSGLIGTQIAKLFVDDGEKTIVYDINPQVQSMSELVDISKLVVARGDVLDLAGLISAIKEHRVDSIVHTAALLPGGLNKNLYNGIKVNTDGTLMVLEASRLEDIKRIVYTSTVGVYSKEGGEGNSFLEDDSPLKPMSLYGATKLMSEYMGTNYARAYGLDFRIVRFANVLGPWSGAIQTQTGGFVKQLLEGALANREVKMPSPPQMVMEAEWVYSSDAARGVYSLMKKDQPKNNTFNIGSGKVSRASEIAQCIEEAVPGSHISLGESKPLSVKPLNIERAKNELQWTPKYDLRSMISEMAGWYKARTRL